jgi:UDP-N-acetylmuramoyl-tripeptide--D-alanyl-D-alanine ligase
MQALILNFFAKALNKIKTDSRAVMPGDLFVAIPGAKVDGHDYIAEAVSRGAVGAVISRPIEISLPTLLVPNTVLALGMAAIAYRAQFSLPIMALTGSCGKTTVKEMTAFILEEVGSTLFTSGNYNTEIGVPITLLQLQASHQRAVIELGARKKGDITYLMDLVKPNIALITNVGVAHLEAFGGSREIAIAKGEIFECLPENGIAIINNDDQEASYWKSLLKPTQTLITFGLDHEADVMTKNIRLEAAFSEFDCAIKGDIFKVRLPVAGRHNVQNAIAAIAAASAFGVPQSAMQQGLERFVTVSGRLQYKAGKNGAVLIDDTYNANPVSMRAALAVLSKQSRHKLFIMGDMVELGSETEKLHGEIGKDAKQQGVDELLAVGSLSKNAVLQFGMGAKHFQDKSSLVSYVLQALNDETTVLIKGSRSMRMEEIVQKLLAPEETSSC